MKLKKLILSIMVFSAAIFILSFTANETKASAAYDRFYYDYYFDSDGNGSKDTSFDIEIDTSAKKARITYIYCSAKTLTIPQVLKNVEIWNSSTYEYEKCDLTVAEICLSSYYDYYDGSYTAIEIPYTVTYITPKTLGYDYVEFIDEYGFWDEDLRPVANMKILCTKGTAGESYAKAGGFAYTAYENISSATVALSGSSFTYTGKAITPAVTVTQGQKKLTANTDYTVAYSSNVNAGTAKVTVTGKGSYRGQVSKTFTIAKKSAANAEIEPITQKTYTGEARKPGVKITLDGKKLSSGKDYTLSYSSNKNPGKATVTITFKGNYTGTKKTTFKIVLANMKKVKATAASSSSIKISWAEIPCTKYYVYRYNSSTKKYELIKTTKSTSYTDKKLTQMKKYTYKVKAVKTVGEKTTSNKAVKVSAYTTPKTPAKLKLAVKSSKITVSWSKNKKVDGYQIYRLDLGTSGYGEFKKVKTIKDKDKGSWTDTKVKKSHEYLYRIRSYRKIDGKNYYSDYVYSDYSSSPVSRLNAVTLKSHRSFKVYNRQGKKTTSYTYTLSDKDIKILKAFKEKHFKSGMDRADKLWVTLEWINRNVKYAVGSDWNKIDSKSWVDAVFTYKLGQCVQYNGAMAAMMAYLGYDVSLVQGYRGTWNTNYWQHFWVEVKIAGEIYIMETGNYGRDGSWSYFLAKYDETSGYIRNQKNM